MTAQQPSALPRSSSTVAVLELFELAEMGYDRTCEVVRMKSVVAVERWPFAGEVVRNPRPVMGSLPSCSTRSLPRPSTGVVGAAVDASRSWSTCRNATTVPSARPSTTCERFGLRPIAETGCGRVECWMRDERRSGGGGVAGADGARPRSHTLSTGNGEPGSSYPRPASPDQLLRRIRDSQQLLTPTVTTILFHLWSSATTMCVHLPSVPSPYARQLRTTS